MSRIGRRPVELPPNVTVSIGDRIEVKGPKGTLSRPVVEGITIRQEDGRLVFDRASDSRVHRANHGLMRALVNNMVIGVSQGFEKALEIKGVGYKAEVKGDKVVFNLGYSHPIEFPIPKGIDVQVDKSGRITVRGIDKELVGQVAANMRRLRPPDSYKGKGVRYVGEVVRLKAAKAAKK